MIFPTVLGVFRAKDLDSLEIGGQVTFQEPLDLSNAAQLKRNPSHRGVRRLAGPLE